MAKRDVKAVCVFCGSKEGKSPSYGHAARTLGAALAERGVTIVFGGDRRGLMGVLADAGLSGGGRVIGVLPELEAERGLAHERTENVVVSDRLTRKQEMASRSDAFIALAGGIGTFDEIFEMLTWSASGVHDKPCALVNTDGYYDDLVRAMDRGVDEGFVSGKNRGLLIVEPTVEIILGRLFEPRAPTAG